MYYSTLLEEMADTIVNGTELNVNNIMYSSPKVNSQGGKSVNILRKDTKTWLTLASPLMLTWGAADFIDEKTGKGNGKFEMSLQFPSDEYKNEETNAFLKNLIELENKIKLDALINSKDWFGKVHKNAEVVEALWTPMLKYPKNKVNGEPDLTKAPTLRIKLPTWENVWKSDVYDVDENKLFPDSSSPNVTPLDFIRKGVQLYAVVQCGGIWFANGKFGMTWKLVQAIVQKPRETLTGKCLIKLKPSDKAKLEAAPAPPASGLDDYDVAEVEDSDDEGEPSQVVPEVVEEEENEEVQSPPAPVVVEEPKKVVKKVVKKKM
jgi:hypothetical protein